MNISKRLCLLLPLGLLLLSACNSQISSYRDPNVTPQGYINGYPVDENKDMIKDDLESAYASLYPNPGNNKKLPTKVNDKYIGLEPLKPSYGKASISGAIYSFTSQIMIPDTKIFLTKAIGVENAPPPVLLSPDESAGDVIGRTEINGLFQINDIPPGNYYLIVWGPDISSIVVDIANEKYSPLLFSFLPNEQYNLGILNVSWP